MTKIAVQNPASGAHLYDVAPATAEDLNKVFAQATSVQTKIAALSIEERINEAVKISDYLVAHQEEVIDKLVQETGKTRFEALSTEIFEVLDLVDYYRDHAKKILQDEKVHTPLVLMGKKSKIVYEPMGVVVAIAPWNYPLYQCFAPALLAFMAGNAVIFKPSEITPLKGLYEEIMEKSGFMANAIQIVYGGKETGAQLIEMQPDKVHFTGSVRAGKQVMAAAAQHLIPVDLELGGKDPAIVFEDVEIEKTANGVVWGAFTNAGQSCTSLERCYVHESIYDEFVEKTVHIASKLKLETPDSTDTYCDMGCMTTEFQLKIVEDQLAEAVEKGARILLGGERVANTLLMPPTVVVDVTHDMKLGSEETFGPVVAIMKFSTEAESIQLANDSIYGLSASVWSKDMERAERVARAIKTGNVSINNHMLTEGNPALPFGGVKQSGFGRFKGDHGLLTFSNVKSIISSANNDVIEPHWYHFTEAKYTMFTQLIQAFFRRPRKWLKFAQIGLKVDTMGNKEKIQ